MRCLDPISLDEILFFVFKKGEARYKDLINEFVPRRCAKNTFLRYKIVLENEGKLRKRISEKTGAKVYYVPEKFTWDIMTEKLLYSIGRTKLEFILWYGTGKRGDEFTLDDVTCEYSEEPLQLPPELQSALKKTLEEKKEEAMKSTQVLDNNPHYRLLGIKPSRKVVDGRDDRKLQPHLIFAPTDFYTCIATNYSLDKRLLQDEAGHRVSIRDKYLKAHNLGDPTYLLNSQLANSFGVALATITEDRKIILQKRSPQVVFGPSTMSVATAEMMVRDIDIDNDGRPSPFVTGKRCVEKELGIAIKPEDVVFLGFGVRLDYALPQALGILRLKMNSHELSISKAIDRWEGFNFVEEFSVQTARKYLSGSYPISPTAKLTILLASVNEFGFEAIERQMIQ